MIDAINLYYYLINIKFGDVLLLNYYNSNFIAIVIIDFKNINSINGYTRIVLSKLNNIAYNYNYNIHIELPNELKFFSLSKQ